jgi:hypothetical protein
MALRRARSCYSHSMRVGEPSGGGGVMPMGEQAVEAQCLGSGMQDIEIIHRTSP